MANITDKNEQRIKSAIDSDMRTPDYDIAAAVRKRINSAVTNNKTDYNFELDYKSMATTFAALVIVAVVVVVLQPFGPMFGEGQGISGASTD